MEFVTRLRKATDEGRAKIEREQKRIEEAAPFTPYQLELYINSVTYQLEQAAAKGKSEYWTCLKHWEDDPSSELSEAFMEKIEKWAKSQDLTTVRSMLPGFGLTISW